MAQSGPGGLKVAPLWRRFAALVVDIVVLAPPILGASVAVRALRSRYAPIWAGSVVAGVAGRNWRGPGYRALRLRRVDVHTGGPVSVRSALVSFLLAPAVGRLTVLMAPPRPRGWESIQAELDEARRAHAGDEERLRRAVAEVYERHGVNPLVACARACAPMLIGTVVTRAPALWSPLNQTIADRLSGTVVVQD